MSFMAPAMTADQIVEGVQEHLLRRQGDPDQPPHLGHRRAGHAPGLAGPRAPGGRRGLRPPGPAHQGPPPQAQDPRHGHQRGDDAAVPAGGGGDPASEARRRARRVRGAVRHGGPDPDHGRAPRQGRVGRRRDGVQPGAVCGGRGRRRQ
jgi:hypothetical protein